MVTYRIRCGLLMK